jgi:hypothetical protein
MSFHSKTVGFKLNIHGISFCKIAFGKTGVIYSIQQICFSPAIQAANANHPFIEIES